HFELLRTTPELQPMFKGDIPLEVVYMGKTPVTRPATHENPLLWHLLPWFLWLPGSEKIAQWSKKVAMEAVTHIDKEWNHPFYVIAGGERKYDVSPCGAQDMLLNAIELVCPMPETNEKRLEPSPYMQVAWIALDRRGPALARLATEDFLTQYEMVMND